MVIMVLLNVEFTCATPEAMFLRSRRLTRAASLAIFYPFLISHTAVKQSFPAAKPIRPCGRKTYFFLPAIALAGPFRVRALVCVR